MCICVFNLHKNLCVCVCVRVCVYLPQVRACEGQIPAATPPRRMDTSSIMTAHKAWNPFVDAVMMRWFGSRAPPKIDRGFHNVSCVRLGIGGESHHPDDAKRLVDSCFARCGGKESVTSQTSVHPYRSLSRVASSRTTRIRSQAMFQEYQIPGVIRRAGLS